MSLKATVQFKRLSRLYWKTYSQIQSSLKKKQCSIYCRQNCNCMQGHFNSPYFWTPSCLCVCSGAAFWWAGATPLSRYSGGGGGQGHFNSPYSWTPLFRGCILVSKGNPTLQIFGGRRRAGDGILLTRLQFRLVRVKVCEHLKRQCHGYSMHWDPSGYCLAVKAENKKDIWEYYTVKGLQSCPTQIPRRTKS